MTRMEADLYEFDEQSMEDEKNNFLSFLFEGHEEELKFFSQEDELNEWDCPDLF